MKVCHNSTHHPESPVAYSSTKCPACRLGRLYSGVTLEGVFAETDLSNVETMLNDARSILERLEKVPSWFRQDGRLRSAPPDTETRS